MTTPRERPILFSAPMVRALLAGTKTQTRRVVRFEYASEVAAWFNERADASVARLVVEGRPRPDVWRMAATGPGGVLADYGSLRCPYGAPGDRLWVKETFAPCIARVRRGHFHYRADGAVGHRVSTNGGDVWWERSGHTIGLADHSLLGVWLAQPSKWKPSIFMPRGASRITLEVTAVRVERLQAISEDDAKAEGVRPFFEEHLSIGPDQRITSGELASGSPFRASFAVLWDTINGAESWAANPWVWVVEFKRVTP